MHVDHESFVAWAEEIFDDIVVTGNEVKVHDPWWEEVSGSPDDDYKCWINTDKCCFHAFKSKRTGSILQFVMEIEGCSLEDAVDIVGGQENLRHLDEKLEEFLSQEDQAFVDKSIKKQVQLPRDTIPIDLLPDHRSCIWASNYLKKRCINTKKLMVCLSGKYKDRIVIPYYNKDGELIYFNTRALSDSSIRYLGPDKDEYKVGKNDVLWMSSWPPDGSKIYLTEGEFDAMSLSQCGLNAGACGGKVLSPSQMQMLQEYRLALAFDADKAGEDMFNIAKILLAEQKFIIKGIPRITVIRPPVQYKDWNKFYQEHEPNVLLAYIRKYETVCNEDTLNSIGFNTIKTH